MTAAYAQVQTRTGIDGAADKCALMDAAATSLTSDSAFNELVTGIVGKAGQAADEQAMAWYEYVAARKYIRDPLEWELYRSWQDVVKSGGDCDDLTIVLLGGLRSIGIQCFTEILTDEQGNGYHVRARVGLPPHAPVYWGIMDPVWQTERTWVMADQDPSQSPLIKGGVAGPPAEPIEVQTPSSWIPPWLAMLSAGLLGWWVGRSRR